MLPLSRFAASKYCVNAVRLSRSMSTKQAMMNALVYDGPGKRTWKPVPKPTIKDPRDVVLRTVATTICGTDLHICKGDVPDVKPGTTLGHEGIGIVEEVGSAVKKYKKGDKVIVSCITSCGNCYYCKRNMQSHCNAGGGWILGHLINGTQAEYVRIPHADYSLYPVPEGADDKALLMLSDILPTGYEIGVLASNIQQGDTVAIVGAGPIGLACAVTCQAFKPAKVIMIDKDDWRLEASKRFGATDTINIKKVANVKAEVARIAADGNKLRTNELLEPGCDVAIECVGVPDSWNICQECIAPGGRIANVGVHGSKVDLNLQELWIKNIGITTGLVNANSTQELLDRIMNGSMDPSKIVTHDFKLCEICKAYDVFGNAAHNCALKVFMHA